MNRPPFEAGDRVRIIGGPMQGHEGVVEMGTSPGWNAYTVKLDDRPECPFFDAFPEHLEAIA